MELVVGSGEQSKLKLIQKSTIVGPKIFEYLPYFLVFRSKFTIITLLLLCNFLKVYEYPRALKYLLRTLLDSHFHKSTYYFLYMD